MPMHEIVGLLRAAAPYEILIALVAGIAAVIARAVRNRYRLRERALRQANSGAVPHIVADEIEELGLLNT